MRTRTVILTMGLLLLGCLAARAGEPYFCTFGNRTLYYERYKAGTQKVIQTTTLDIGAVLKDGPMHHGDVWSDTWYAPGIGFVRHDSFDKKMRLESSEILLEDRRNPTQ